MNREKAVLLQEELFPRLDYEYREGTETRHVEYKPTLCDICLNVRMSINGASDPWADEWLVKTRNMLEVREKTWTDNKDLIDALIHTMVWHTVRMIDKELFRRNHNKAPIRGE